MANAIIKKGETITCPQCETSLMLMAKDIHTGDLINSSCFTGINHQPVDGALMRCPICEAMWGGVKLHTKEGWK